MSKTTPENIPGMLLASCARHGERVAFQQADGAKYLRLSYGQLEGLARKFATTLAGLGLRPGDRVGIICENRLEWPVAYFGQALAGGVAVPIYPELEGMEMANLLRRVETRFLVATDVVLKKLDGLATGVEQVILVGSSRDLFAPACDASGHGEGAVLPFHRALHSRSPEEESALAGQLAQPDDLASIVFTSGTTGAAKGVMLTHHNFMANIRAMARTLPVSARDRLLVVLPLHHAFPFTIGLLMAVALGAEVTLESDLLRIARRFEEVKPTVFVGVPALFEIMERNVRRRVERLGKARAFERALMLSDAVKARSGVNIGRILFRQLHGQLGGSLRFMISGGSALSPQVARRFYLLGIPLLQGWGLTETAPVVSVQRWRPFRFYFTRYYEERAGSVGQPLPGVDVTLIDVPEKELLVAADGQGELVVRGPNVTPGYWEAPETTREALSRGWFKTGDIGRIDREGNLWITGRRKYIIVLDSGEKVHPDEVEEQLGQSELIEDVCVVPRSARGKTQAWVVVYPSVGRVKALLHEQRGAVSADAVRRVVAGEVERLQGQLASYKRPAHLVLSDQPLPKTAILKVARERLQQSYEFRIDRWLASAGSEGD